LPGFLCSWGGCKRLSEAFPYERTISSANFAGFLWRARIDKIIEDIVYLSFVHTDEKWEFDIKLLNRCTWKLNCDIYVN
jgi:hypothetical protein